MKKIALYWQILIGVLLGVFVGILLSQFAWRSELVQIWIKPFCIRQTLDMCRTVVNLTGDAAISMIVAESEG